MVGAPHEARFIVDEALGLGFVLGHPDAPRGALDPNVVAAARSHGRPPSRRGAAAVRLRALAVPLARPPGRPARPDPAPETEQVVEVALAEARHLAAAGPAGPLVVVDAGTGSGAIALSLASELGAGMVRELWATDVSADALAVAVANLAALRGRNGPPLPLVELAEGSWLEPLPTRLRGEVALVVSNPPYVSEAQWEELDAEVRAEPRRALVAGPSSDGTPGLAEVEAVLVQARAWLARPGVVVVELAPLQAGAAMCLAERLGFAGAQVVPDLARRPRALVARTGGDATGP